MFFKRLVITLSCLLLFMCGTFSLVGCADDTFTVRFQKGATDASLYYGREVQKVSSSSQIVEPIYIRPGYNFAGWNKSISLLDKDSTVVAQWKAYEFEVVFYANGGADALGNKIVVVQTDSAYNLVENQPNFIKVGYDLSWDMDLNLITKSCSVNAVWTPKKYDLVFKDILGNDFANNTLKVSYNDKIDNISITPPHVDGKKFAYWVGSGNGLPLDSGVIWKFDNSETFEPVYVLENQFLIKYDINGGKRSEKRYYYSEQDQNVQILTNPVRDGYVFDGWLINDGTVPKLSEDITINDFKVNGAYQDVKLTAVWESRPYNITFNADGGTILGEDQKRVWFGESVGELPVAEKEGYEFLGWECDSEIVPVNYVWEKLTDKTFKAVYKARYYVSFTLTTSIGKDDQELLCKLVKWGGVVNDGQTEFTQVVFELLEGQSLYSRYGFEVMPVVDPIEQKGENKFSFGNRWDWIDANQNKIAVNQATIFSADNLSGIKGGDTIILVPFCKVNWSPKY